jgi:hypothetical protein
MWDEGLIKTDRAYNRADFNPHFCNAKKNFVRLVALWLNSLS